MKKRRSLNLSLFTILIIGLTLIQFRSYFSDISGERKLQITTWDALGYYLYLPAIFIYDDYTKCEWFEEIDEKYQVSGGWVYQLSDLPNGNRVGKYLGGVAVLQMPFFFVGHAIALNTSYPADGFSAPYQYAIGFGCIVWFLIGLLILRRVLLYYFNDRITALTLLLLVLATNAIQYASVDNAMSHGFIFTLYSMLLLVTIQWHQNPRRISALFMGMVIGLACISRPTELIMILIPILWHTHTKESARQKWAQVRRYRHHILFLALGGLFGIAPQVIYWKQVTGSFIYDVGSKWDFLTPHFQVLFGWKKGMFIYTPLTILFIVGMFLKSSKQYPFRKSVIWFGLLNIYIIIAWHHWEYGASYATRALMQSYPLYAIPLAIALQHFLSFEKWKYVVAAVSLYLIGVNVFQTWQYNTTVLHYNDMNRKYYARIYLNPAPNALDMSLLDTDEVYSEKEFPNRIPFIEADKIPLSIPANDSFILYQKSLNAAESHDWAGITEGKKKGPKVWVRIKGKASISKGMWKAYIKAEVKTKNEVKVRKIRLWNPICEQGQSNNYEFYIKVPDRASQYDFKLSIHPEAELSGVWEELHVEEYWD